MLAVLDRFPWLSELSMDEQSALDASMGQAVLFYSYRLILLPRRQQLEEVLGAGDKIELDYYNTLKTKNFEGDSVNMDDVVIVRG